MLEDIVQGEMMTLSELLDISSNIREIEVNHGKKNLTYHSIDGVALLYFYSL